MLSWKLWLDRRKFGLDGEGEFDEGRGELVSGVDIQPELVVAATRFCTNACPVQITRAKRSRFSPRIGLSLDLSRP